MLTSFSLTSVTFSTAADSASFPSLVFPIVVDKVGVASNDGRLSLESCESLAPVEVVSVFGMELSPTVGGATFIFSLLIEETPPLG